MGHFLGLTKDTGENIHGLLGLNRDILGSRFVLCLHIRIPAIAYALIKKGRHSMLEARILMMCLDCKYEIIIPVVLRQLGNARLVIL